MATAYLGVVSPFAIFIDPRTGKPLESGYIYIGAANYDAEANPLTTYWDSDLTITAPQPIRTLSGFMVRKGTPTNVYIAELGFSITVKDKNKNVLYRAFNVTATPSNILDEDDFASDSAINAPSQQSAKAYISSGTITMTNKTLASPIINTPIMSSPVITGGTLNGGGALTVDSDELNQLDGLTVDGTSNGDIVTKRGNEGLLIPIAYGRVEYTGSITASKGVNSVVQGSTGFVTVNLSSTIASNNTIVVVSGEHYSINAAGYYNNTSSVMITTYTIGAGYSFAAFNFVVFKTAA